MYFYAAVPTRFLLKCLINFTIIHTTTIQPVAIAEGIVNDGLLTNRNIIVNAMDNIVIMEIVMSTFCKKSISYIYNEQ
jgi:hypothetical protein